MLRMLGRDQNLRPDLEVVEVRPSQLLLSKPAVRTKTARSSFNQTAPSVWNSLPVEIRVSETARQFRTAIRTRYYRLAFNN